MKTQEDIDNQAKLEGERIYMGMSANEQRQRDAFINGFCNGAKAMQLYSAQQNKELRESRPFQFSPTNSEREWQVKIVNDYIHPNQEDWQKMNAVCNSLIEIQRLTKEVERLENVVAELTIGATGGSAELTRLRELYGANQKLIKAIDGLDVKSGNIATENIRTILNQIEKEK